MNDAAGDRSGGPHHRIEGTTAMVELRELRRVFREGERIHTVLDGVELEVAPGERVALLGRSGSGKSTLLNLIAGIDLPDHGRVIVDGARLDRLSERERTLLRRHQIGIVFQFFNLLPTLTVAENVLLPLELAGRPSRARRAAALELLELVGLAERARSFPDVLSGGEQQRVAIARALAHEPRLILADEPTGNLDADTAEQVLELFDRALDAAGATFVIATHSREVARRSDRVLAIRDARLIELPHPNATADESAP